MGFLAGKRAFIVGVATDRSIAWGIAQAMQREGAELAFSYVNDKMKERVEPLAHSIGSKLTMPLDVTVDGQVDSAFDLLKREWGQLDIVIHAVAFAPREAIAGSFTANTTREAFRIAHDVLRIRAMLARTREFLDDGSQNIASISNTTKRAARSGLRYSIGQLSTSSS